MALPRPYRAHREQMPPVRRAGSRISLRSFTVTMSFPTTPDGRYFVVRGRLWRCSNPNLSAQRRAQLTHALMDARRSVLSAKRAENRNAEVRARSLVNDAKQALGERGPVWWTDGDPDWNRYLAKNTMYADWYAALHVLPQ